MIYGYNPYDINSINAWNWGIINSSNAFLNQYAYPNSRLQSPSAINNWNWGIINNSNAFLNQYLYNGWYGYTGY